MKFMPVAETRVLVSVWDTRVRDFRAFVDSTGYNATKGMFSAGSPNGAEQRGDTREEPGFDQGPSDPVVGVNYHDATAFCEWLTKRECASGVLPNNMHYRLFSWSERRFSFFAGAIAVVATVFSFVTILQKLRTLGLLR